MTKNKSLKSEILLRLIIPLIFFVALETVLSYFVTLHYVDKTYDRWLLDSARSLAQEIKIKEAQVQVELPHAALEIFKWDDLDKTYFKISSAEQGMIAGDSFVPEALNQEDQSNPVFFKAEIHGEPVRIVSMQVFRKDTQDRFFVHVAETLNKRKAMMTDILLADLIPQIVLVLFACLYLLVGLKRGLKPLNILAAEIAQRSPRDLSPIAEAHVFVEVRALTDTINDLLKRLAEAITAQQRFIANAAHQLRTPLAGLVIQAERALREQDLAAIKPALTQMQSCADRLSHTVTQLLVLAKSGPIDGMNELKPLDLYELVKTTCIDWAPKALHRQMDLSLECSEPAIFVRGDEVLLRELLANLLDNAISYGHKNGNILVSLKRSPSPILTVEDDGPGIPDYEKNKIFERFYRIPDSPGNGCGLGLAIVKEIADLHKALLVLSQKNSLGGTRIVLVFE
ncbi:sensor protein QseC [Methyloglobulus morosus KoM1]|uniref:histidine kinase n=1 Tax=Methyloglobulus morosus KoM1 TaxID=1116472 RepID=V5BVA2_9GAMM|nr:sensor histidine kinase [Methyloglobulus morosus]ESS70132.1 sensor protein QseC [Methyloglobulus morosus KoM1]